MSPPEAPSSPERARFFSAAFLAVCFGSILVLVTGPSCSSDETIDAGMVGEDAAVSADAPAPDARGFDATLGTRDAEIIVFHDAGAPASCDESCDCPQGLGCVGGTCRVLGAPVYCCSKQGCPVGQACLAENDRPQTCPVPDAGPAEPTCERPDASPPTGADAGLGSIGAACDFDTDCNQALGYSCWERSEPPFLWGYCTLEGCVGGCPQGSMCLQFNIPPPDGPVTGCLQTCNVDADCRTDAYCFFIANGGFSICLPNCRDDIFDCAPRDGSNYCDPISGECLPNMCHAASGTGDPCVNNQDCVEGHVCMTEAGWGFPGGMCSRVCSGLPESAPCLAGETCQSFAGVGFCFDDCVNNGCPSRPSALCTTLDPAWSTPSCIAL